MAVGLTVIQEVQPFKERQLTAGLPHGFAMFVGWGTMMLVAYFEWWIAGLVFGGFFWVIGRVGTNYDAFWFEILLRLPTLPRVLAP